MLEAVAPAMLGGGEEQLTAVQEMDQDIDRLHAGVIDYLGRLSQRTLTGRETTELIHLMSVCNAFESMGDVIESDLVRRGRERLADGVEVSDPTVKVIREVHQSVVDAARNAVLALKDGDPELAGRVVEQKTHLNQLAERAALHQADRLLAPEGGRVLAYAVETDMIEGLRRVFYYAKRIAHEILELQDGAVTD